MKVFFLLFRSSLTLGLLVPLSHLVIGSSVRGHCILSHRLFGNSTFLWFYFESAILKIKWGNPKEITVKVLLKTHTELDRIDAHSAQSFHVTNFQLFVPFWNRIYFNNCLVPFQVVRISNNSAFNGQLYLKIINYLLTL